MMRFKNLTLIGTSHVAVQSIRDVREIIQEVKPDIVALELDKRRFMALMRPAERKIRLNDILRMGLWAFAFNALGAWVEEKFGKMVGVKPGSEMRTAAIEASKANAKLALVDRDITITLKRLKKEIKLKEILTFFYDVFIAVVFRKGEVEDFDLTKVPSKELIQKLIDRVKKRYPSFYKVLIEERNQYMAKRLSAIINNHPYYKIIAIVGAGHEEDMLVLIKKYIKT